MADPPLSDSEGHGDSAIGTSSILGTLDLPSLSVLFPQDFEFLVPIARAPLLG